MKKLFMTFALLVVFFLPGCSHGLKTDYDLYSSTPIIHRSPATIGIILDGKGQRYEELSTEFISNLNQSGAFQKIYYPYFKNTDKVDYEMTIFFNQQTKGYSGNFFVSWPGYYIFLPALHGFKYRHNLIFTAEIIDLETGRRTTLDLNDQIRIRHSDIDRTWIQAGWLWLWPVWDIAAIIGGANATSYDKSITKEAMDNYQRDYSKYITSKIIESIISIGGPINNPPIEN